MGTTPKSIDNLAGENYKNWSICMRSYLLSQGLWEVIEASMEPILEDSEPDFEAWRKKNAAALLAIQNSCTPGILSQIREMASAKVVWDFLSEKYESKALAVNSPFIEFEEESEERVGPNQDQPDMLEDPQATANNPFDDQAQSPEDFRYSRSKSSLARVYSVEKIDKGTGEDIDYSQFKSLYEALRKGNWGLVRSILNSKPDAINEKISFRKQIPLHVATIFGHMKIVENLVDQMSEDDLEIQDGRGKTALAHAAQTGRIEIAKFLIRKKHELVTIGDKEGDIPVVLASLAGHKDMARYLYYITPPECFCGQNDEQGSLILACFIHAKMFGIHIQVPAASSDIRVNILQNIQNEKESNKGEVLCQFHRLVLKLLELFGIKKIYDMKLMHTRAIEVLSCMTKQLSTLDTTKDSKVRVIDAFFGAAKKGIVEFVRETIKADFELIFIRNTRGYNVFQYAIFKRQAKIFSLLYELDLRKLRVLRGKDSDGDNTLHYAGYLPTPSRLNHISGAALQMQRELQWYKEVEKMTNHLNKERPNDAGYTPRELFTRKHKDLVKKGEKWMKGTATSCTIVGALIVTIMFAAAFTVPGGNDQNTGFPIFLQKKLFMVFIISDAISLFSSSTSVLMFLGILTSRYTEDDFLKDLPTKLIIGLSTLFFSIAAMMVAFSAALFIMLEGYLWITIPIIFLASVPVTLFVLLQFSLLVEIFMSTYGTSIFDRKVKP